jgi:predicted transcriptional regulator
MNKVNMHVGTIEDMGNRFKDAWNRAEIGEIEEESHLTFYSLETFLSTLTPKRMELLKEIHKIGKVSIRALAGILSRDYKNVYEDVSALSNAGLLVKQEDGIVVPWDEISASLVL